jgi:NAD(P)H-hydrate epimerase
MYDADQAAIDAGVSSESLMDSAGAAIARHVGDRYEKRKVVVLCGPGNNGGDGFVAGRYLVEAGWDVSVALLGKKSALKGDAAKAAKTWKGKIAPLSPDAIEDAELVVDAIFGAGLSRDIEGEVRATLEAVIGRGLPVVAVDVPSGVNGDTGHVQGIAVVADLTVTFFRRKTGHTLMPGRHYSGETVVADIGIPDSALTENGARVEENHPDLWLARYPWPQLDGHKYDRGYAVVVASNPDMTGAARLAARGALRIGAGLVGIVGPAEATAINAVNVTSVMTASYANKQGFIDFISDSRRNAILLGPGNGISDSTRENVLAALALGKACVLDADALSVFRDDPETLFEALSDNCLLTPHSGEFMRLFGNPSDNSGSKLAQTREAAERCGATVLFKGADTVIAAPDGRAVINTNAPPELATAGAGDVLAGFAIGLMAQGLDSFTAASASAWLHGETARAFGPGLISEDLNETLPGVLKELKARL